MGLSVFGDVLSVFPLVIPSNPFEVGLWCVLYGVSEGSDPSVFWPWKGFNVIGGLVRR